MKICIEDGCTKQANYNLDEETALLYCTSHKKEGMVDIKNRKNRCIEPGCKTRACFNEKGTKIGQYCVKHKQDGMIDVKCVRCRFDGCMTRARYWYENETIPTYCAKHKKEGMVNKTRKKCKEPDCDKFPAYNYINKLSGMYCVTHKKKDMVNVICKACNHNGCYTRALYNYEGETPICCVIHKTEGMINVTKRKCTHKGCKIKPSYNFASEISSIYCVKHKKEGMIHIHSKKCIEEGCITIPCYNYEHETVPLYCVTHKKDRMVDIVGKSCKSEWCSTKIKDKYDGYCMRCFIYLFPDKPVSRNYKTKEFAVTEYVTSHFRDVDWQVDKIIDGGCSKRRPDLLVDLGYQVLIVEVDENQHNDYDTSCENKRIAQLYQDVGRSIVMIRFNPDSYMSDGERVPSCWTYNKRGICVVKKTKKKEWHTRLHALREHIEYWISNKTNKEIEMVHLYYDSHIV